MGEDITSGSDITKTPEQIAEKEAATKVIKDEAVAEYKTSVEKQGAADKITADAQRAEDFKIDNFNLSEGSFISKERLEEIASYSKEQGFSKDQAQNLIERENEAITNYNAGVLKQMDKLVTETWVEQIKTDKETGGEKFEENMELARRALKATFSSEFVSLMELKSEENPNGTGYINHPEFVRGMVRMGKGMSNDNFEFGKQGGKGEKLTRAEILYPKSFEKK